MRTSILLLLAFSLPLAACSGKVILDTDGATTPAGAGGSLAEPPDAGPVAPPQCLCPDAPGYAPCVHPEECCPTVGVCKNPATWNCSGSSLPCP